MQEPTTSPSVSSILKRPRILALLAALIVLVIVLITACGGDDSSDPAAVDPSTVETIDPGEDPGPTPEAPPETPSEATPGETVDPSALPIVKVKGKALKRNSENNRVKQLQEALEYLGYLEAGSADGQFGQKTKKAVQEFQLELGLNGDGVAGQQTIRAINKAVKAAPAGGQLSTPADADAGTGDGSGDGSGDTDGSGDGSGDGATDPDADAG